MVVMITRPMARRLLHGFAFILFGVAVAAAAPAPGNRNRKLSDELSRRVSAKGATTVDVIVRFRATPGNSERSLLQSLGGQIQRQHRKSRWISLRLPSRAVKALEANPNVEYIAVNASVSAAMDHARPAAGSPTPTDPESWLTGAGVTIAMLDSGVAIHPEIQTLVGAVDFVQPVVPPGDPNAPPLSPTGIDPNGH